MKKSKLLAVVLVFVMTLSLLPTAALANEKAVYTGTGYATSVSVVKGETDDVFVSSTIFRDGTKLYGSKTDDEQDVIAAIKYRKFGSGDSYVDVPDDWIANRFDNKFDFNTTNIDVGSYDIQITLNFTGTFNNGTKDDPSDDENISVTGIIADTTLEVFPNITDCEEPLVLTVADLTASYTKIGQSYLPIPFKVMCGENDVSGLVKIRWEKVEGVTMGDSDPEKGSDGTYTFGHLYPYQTQVCGTVPIKAWAVYGEGASAKESNHVTFYVTMTDCDQMFAAQIGSTGYTTLAEAIEAAESGQTVTLLKDVDLNSDQLQLNKAITIDGGAEKHSITSKNQDVVKVLPAGGTLSGTVKLSNLRIKALDGSGRAIGIGSSSAITGLNLTVENCEITTKQRGITVYGNGHTGINLTVSGTTISLLKDGGTTYDYDTEYNNGDTRGISLWKMGESTVSISGSTIQGFAYSINNGSQHYSDTMTVNIESSTLKGRAAINDHTGGTKWNLTGTAIRGINNQNGPSESFGCIVFDSGAGNNTCNVNNCVFTTYFNEVGGENAHAKEFMFVIRADGNTVKVDENSSSSSYTILNGDKGGVRETGVQGDDNNSTIALYGGTYSTDPSAHVAQKHAAIEKEGVWTIGKLYTATFTTAPESATVTVKKADGTEIQGIEKTFADLNSALTYNYTVSRSGYYSKSGTIDASGLTWDGTNNVWNLPVIHVALSAIPSDSDSSGSSSTTTPSQPTTSTETKPDGSTTTTESKPDGTVTETVKLPNGTIGTVVTDKNGEVTQVTASVSSTAARNANKTGEAVTLPVEVPAVTSTEDAPAVQVTVPKSAGSVKVEIPVEKVTPGTVAVIVKADGTEEIVKTSVLTEDGVVLKLEGSATVKVIDNAKDFSDTKGHWAEDAISFVTARGMFSGTTETTFAPDSAMTRAMLCTVLARFDGEDTTGGSVWYEKGMEWAKANGVSDGSNPNGSITREQLATMLWRYSGSPAVEGGLDRFSDADKVSGYAVDAMRWAVEIGLIDGIGNDTLAPQGDATRAQLATILTRYCENLAQ